MTKRTYSYSDLLMTKGDHSASARNYRRAIWYFSLAARLGVPEGDHCAAYYMEQMRGREKLSSNIRYKKAIKSGVSYSATNLAINAANRGDRYQCLLWLKVAKRLGDSEARQQVAHMLRSNLDLPDFKD